ncbi:ketopantoate reductase family protein [Actinomyces culturomici]|uniref:ketopantoate reductase family protein n=1 Tax=Actinomyces culturomici TaxID=1926276 RepID=UPI000E201FF9|nr:2-dehydropantoate 2-reductase [Actinomyces culturomici]
MKIAIIGSGGVGGYHACALIDAGAEVHLLSTDRHVTAIARDGLVLQTDEGERAYRPASVSIDGEGVGVCDLVLITVKLGALDAALEAARPLVGPGTLVVTLENGVVAPDRAAALFGAERVVPGVTFIVAYVEGPGVVRQVGSRPRLVLGSHPLGAKGRDPRMEAAAALFDSPAVRCVLDEDVAHLLWVKFALICTMGGVNILANATTGEVMTSAGTRALVRESLEEVRAVAAAHGVRLADADLDADFAQLERLAPSSTTSLQRDLREGRESELEFLNGDLVERAEAAGIDVPVNRIALAVARLHAERRHV